MTAEVDNHPGGPVPGESRHPASGQEPGVLARPATHDTVVHILGSLSRGRLLDVPAGQGALASRLSEAGFEVYCCDLYPEIFRLPGVEIKRGDLTAALPYDSGSFEYVTCVEGLEHTENPAQAIREFHRLLRPGGRLIISVPNILNIEERIKWLLHGYTSHFKPLSRAHIERTRQQYDGLEAIALHVHPISYSELRYLLEKSRFRVERISRDAPKPNLWLYWPLVGFIRLLAFLTPENKRRERWTRELQSDAVLLGGNTLIVQALKE